MSGKDDPFGSGGKTVIIPNPGGAPQGAIRSSRCRPLSPQPAQPPPLQPARSFNPSPPRPAAARRPMPTTGYERRGARRCRPPAGRAGRADPRTPQAPCSPTRRIPLEVALNASRRGGVLGANPITPGGRAAADPARAAAPAYRRHAGRAADEPCRAGDHRVREEDRGDAGVHAARGAGRQIRAVRHRRRHRPEPAGHRPACLDAVQHAGAVLPGAHLGRRLLRGAEQGARQSGAALQSARADACLPAARLRGPVSRRGRRRQRIAAHPPRRLPDAAPRQGAQRRRHFAALARHGAAACGDVGAQGAALGDRQRRRRCCWSACFSCCAS